MEKINQIEKNIRNLTIQGATNVALAVLEGMQLAVNESFKLGKQASTFLKVVAEKLAYARPTEPLAQNAVRYIFDKDYQPVQYYLERIIQYRKMIEEAKNKMKFAGRNYIQNGGVYLTHCHSSTVLSMFIEAKREGKRFCVIATETRPLYQGRVTVRELIKAEIDEVVLIIDDCAVSLIEGKLKHIDAVFIGADLLSQKGFINKVGSLGLALACKSRNIPLYCLSILLKYDPRPFSPKFIEQRNGAEIWPEAPKSLNFFAPAFDYISYSYGVKIISEAGIIAGSDIERCADMWYTFLKRTYG